MHKITCFRLMALCFLIANLYNCSSPPANSINSWNKADSIISQIQIPSFPSKKFYITTYGAQTNKDCSEAFKLCIQACNKAGGGEVIVTPGTFFTGPIHLKSNVNLHLEKGSIIKFLTDPKKYLPLVLTRWEGVELMNYSPLIYAYDQQNIAITGDGMLDGCATEVHWWPWKGLPRYGWKPGMPSQKDKLNRPALFAMGEKDIGVQSRKFGENHYLRPQFIQPYRCKNVLIQGVKVINSPMWVIHPVLCNNVTIDRIRVESDGPNTDGCDPESCRNVWIKNCYFNTGDDCIALKSGRNRDGRRIGAACENVVIQNCKMANGHGGIVIGSEISGGVRNVFAENCIMSSPLLDRAFRLKSSSARGGITENIFIRNIEVGQVKEQAIMATMFYEDSGAYIPAFKNIEISNMRVRKGGNWGIVVEGYKDSPVENFKLSNIQISDVKHPYYISNAKGIKLERVTVNKVLVKIPFSVKSNTTSVPIAR